MNAETTTSENNEITFDLVNDAVFDTALATLQFSVLPL